MPDRVSNPGPLNYESGALPIALRGPAMADGLMKGDKHNQLPYSIWFMSYGLDTNS